MSSSPSPQQIQGVAEAVEAKRKRKRQGIVNGPLNIGEGLLESKVLAGLPAPQELEFVISVMPSTHLHKHAKLGDALVVYFNPRSGGYPTFRLFMVNLMSIYTQVGENAIKLFGKLTYSLQFDIVISKPGAKRVQIPFLLFPLTNRKVVTAKSEPFNENYVLGPLQQLWNESFKKFAQSHGSGWSLDEITGLEMQLLKVKYSSGIAGGWWKFQTNFSYNVKNTDERCFQWAIVSFLHWKEVKESGLSTSVPASYAPFIDRYDWSGIEFTEKGVNYKHASLAFEERNPGYAVSIWGRDDYRTPHRTLHEPYMIRVSDKIQEAGIKHIDLYLAMDPDSNKEHLVCIHDLNKFYNEQFKEVCRWCAMYFVKEGELTQHYLDGCPEEEGVYEPKAIMPREKIITFKAYHQLLKASLVLFVTGSRSKAMIGEYGNDTHLRSIDWTYEEDKYDTTTLGDVTRFTESFRCEHTTNCYCHIHAFFLKVLNVIYVHWSDWKSSLSSESNPHLKPKLLDREEAEFQRDGTCHICCQAIGSHQVKVRDHCHVTGEYRGAAHYKPCNFNYSYHHHRLPVIVHGETFNDLVYTLVAAGYGLDMPHHSANSDNLKSFKLKKLDGIMFIRGDSFFQFDPHRCSLRDIVDKWQQFREFSLCHYRLDPVHFNSLPSLAWAAALYHSGATLELTQSEKVYRFMERAKRGAINVVAQRYEVGNFPEMGSEYNPDEPTKYMYNFDIQSSYGWSMKQPLPYNGYEQLDCMEFRNVDAKWILSLHDDGPFGYFLEVDLSVPNDQFWHDKYARLPLAPDHKEVNGKKQLVCSFERKEKYVVHYRLLKFYLQCGMVLEKIHAMVRFNQRPWLRSFMQKQETLRNDASNDETKKLIKLITNSIYGYSCVNSGGMCDTRFYSDRSEEEMQKFRRWGFTERTTYVHKENSVIVARNKWTMVLLNQCVGVGAAIMELGKLQLYQWYYDKLDFICDNLQLLYADTDSLICSVSQCHTYKELQESFFKPGFGNLKEECDWNPGVRFVGVRPKHYVYETMESKKVCASGLPKYVSSTLTGDVFKDVIDNKTETKVSITRNMKDGSKCELERVLVREEDLSRYYLNPYKSVPYGHYKDQSYYNYCINCDGWRNKENPEVHKCYCEEIEDANEPPDLCLCCDKYKYECLALEEDIDDDDKHSTSCICSKCKGWPINPECEFCDDDNMCYEERTEHGC